MDDIVKPRIQLSTTRTEPLSVLIVDDQPANLEVLGKILHNDYRVYTALNGEQTLELVKRQIPDLILMDIMMPGISGYDVVRYLKKDQRTSDIPVIFVTANNDIESESLGFEHQAVDYITKPVVPEILSARVKTHLSLVKADQLKSTRLEIIRHLGRAAEYKDEETGKHVIRMSHYSHILGNALGLAEIECEELLNAAPMHDVGKIGIPDHILLKPGKLNDEEMKVMRTHTILGAEIIGEDDSELLRLAASIALTHHEKWDGSGYPNSLAGEDIPLEGRIVAIADVFDALTTKRPYKEAWPVEKAVSFIQDQSGKHFDPMIVSLFEDKLQELLEIKERWTDTDTSHH